jgi:DNA-binding response OmpR family regulator
MREPALIVMDDAAMREAACRDLHAAGYEPVAFVTSADALPWLEEETPQVALLDADDDPACVELLRELLGRDVEIVFDDAPMPIPHAMA